MKTTSFAIISLLGAITASAATITYDFSSPANTDLGSYTHSFVSTPTGYTITAYGFEGGKTNNLYVKNQGAGETGLGLYRQDASEIDTKGLVVLDISSLSSALSLQLEIASVDFNEGFAIYGLSSGDYSGNSTAPKISAIALYKGGSSVGDKYFSVPDFASYHYLALSATKGNVLLEGLTANIADSSLGSATPEPATMGFVGLALVCVALGGRLVRERKA